MATVIDLGSHTAKFGSQRLESPWLLPQHLLTTLDSKNNNQSLFQFGDYQQSAFVDGPQAIKDGQINDFDKIEQIFQIVQNVTSSKCDPQVSQFIMDITRQCQNNNRITTTLSQIELLPTSIQNKLFQQLDSPQQKLIIATPHNPLNKNKMAQMLFEKQQVQQLCFADQTSLALFSSGRVSGICLQLGHQLNNFHTVQEGYWLSTPTVLSTHAAGELAGRVLNRLLYQQNICLEDDPESRFMLTSIKNQMQFDQCRSIRMYLPDGCEFDIHGTTLQKLSKIYTDPGALGIQDLAVNAQLSNVVKQIPPSNQQQTKWLHITGGMANIRPLVQFVQRKWEYEQVPIAMSAQNPQNDCYLGGQTLGIVGQDQLFVDKKLWQEKGDNVWYTTNKDDTKKSV